MFYNIKKTSQNICINCKQFIKFAILNNLFIIKYLFTFTHDSIFYNVVYCSHN